MGIYAVKGTSGRVSYMKVIKQIEDGYVVRIVRDEDGYTDVKTSFISTALFDSCIRTGYIEKIDVPEEKLAANA
ncbi:MAG: hypothetical protein IIU15_06095 [Treponema sp.]|nr:hypothetical protein [Treponema sp.]